MSYNSKFKTTDDILNTMFMVRAPLILKYADEDFDIGGVAKDVVNGVAVKTDLTRFDTFGMTLREIAIAASDGHPLYLIRKEDSQPMFDMLEEYLVRTTHNFEYNRSEEDTSFRVVVQEFANNMVTVNNADMYKNKAAVKMQQLFPNAKMVDDFVSTPKNKKSKSTVSYN